MYKVETERGLSSWPMCLRVSRFQVYFSSLPLGIYLLMIGQLWLGVVLVSLVPSTLLLLVLYGFCQCLCHELREALANRRHRTPPWPLTPPPLQSRLMAVYPSPYDTSNTLIVTSQLITVSQGNFCVCRGIGHDDLRPLTPPPCHHHLLMFSCGTRRLSVTPCRSNVMTNIQYLLETFCTPVSWRLSANQRHHCSFRESPREKITKR